MKEHIDEMTKVLVDYTKKQNIMASVVILEDYAEELYTAGYRKQEWISVEERLPEDMLPTDYKYKTIKVLVAIKGKNGVTIRTQQRFLDYTYRDDKRTSFWTWRFSGGDVTHWMPLPEAPKMKGGAE